MKLWKLIVVTPPRKHARKSFVQLYAVMAPTPASALAFFSEESNTLPGDTVLIIPADGSVLFRDSYMATPGRIDDLRAEAIHSETITEQA